MGYDQSPLWKRYRAAFPVSQRFVYLNHAGVAPLCRPAADAMRELASDALEFGSYHYDAWLATYDALRSSAARLTGALPEEIALVKNTSEGIATVAIGLDWRAGDKVVAFKEEFPANYFPWKRLEARGVSVEWLSVEDSLDRVDEACRGARLLALSFVQYLGGLPGRSGSRRRDLPPPRVSVPGGRDPGPWGASRWMSASPASTPWQPTATNGCWARKVAVSYTYRRTCRIPSSPSNSAGPTWPATTTTPAGTWPCAPMPAATNAEP